MAIGLSCIIHEIKRDSRKTPTFHTPLHLTYTVIPFEFLYKILTQTAGVPTLLDVAKILPKR